MQQRILLLSLLIVSFSACKKDRIDPIDANNKGTFSIEFDNFVGGKGLLFNERNYTNTANETFTISRVQYFVSNIKLYNADGSTYTVPLDPVEKSYFLINGEDPKSRFATIEAPEGDYTKVSFVLGVDSLRSTMGLDNRTGVLDPTSGDHSSTGMYWGWNSGYIFFKMEGNSPSIPDNPQGDPTNKKQFRYHIGGFGGYSAPTINNIKTITMELTNVNDGVAKVRKDMRSNVHLFVDLMKIFDGPTQISIVQNPQVMFSAFSTQIADNFSSMFAHDHTENFLNSVNMP